MKRTVELLVSGVVISVGIEIGSWLWEETIEDKLNGLVERLKEK